VGRDSIEAGRQNYGPVRNYRKTAQAVPPGMPSFAISTKVGEGLNVSII
jgi:hypothetical protein